MLRGLSEKCSGVRRRPEWVLQSKSSKIKMPASGRARSCADAWSRRNAQLRSTFRTGDLWRAQRAIVFLWRAARGMEPVPEVAEGLAFLVPGHRIEGEPYRRPQPSSVCPKSAG